MIRFSLQCKEAHHFDAWFRSGDDFNTQQKRGLLACPECGSTHVAKALMTPSVPKKSNQTASMIEPEPGEAQTGEAQTGEAQASEVEADETQTGNLLPASSPKTPAPEPVPMTQSQPQNPFAALPPELKGKVMSAVKEWRDTVIASSEHVGPRFAEEARKIHFEEADKRPIYGEASADEVQELLEDGIPCAPLPVLPEDHN